MVLLRMAGSCSPALRNQYDSVRGGRGGTTSSTTVRSATPYHAPDSVLLCNAAASLARNMDDPLFHHDEHRNDDAVYAAAADGDDAVNVRNPFLLSRHLTELGLHSVIALDQIDCLHGEARAKTTGFRSALRQLDRVTNVSSCRWRAKGVHGSHSASGSSASAAACL